MDKLAKLEYIEKMIHHSLNLDFAKNISMSKRIAQGFRITSIVLGSTVTVVLGISNSPIASNTALILSGFITILGSIDALFNYHNKTLQQYQYVTNLIMLQIEIKYYRTGRTAEEIEDDAIQRFYERYLSLLSTLYNERVNTTKMSFEATMTEHK